MRERMARGPASAGVPDTRGVAPQAAQARGREEGETRQADERELEVKDGRAVFFFFFGGGTKLWLFSWFPFRHQPKRGYQGPKNDRWPGLRSFAPTGSCRHRVLSSFGPSHSSVSSVSAQAVADCRAESELCAHPQAARRMRSGRNLGSCPRKKETTLGMGRHSSFSFPERQQVFFCDLPTCAEVKRDWHSWLQSHLAGAASDHLHRLCSVGMSCSRSPNPRSSK